eukprot:PhM_4_TR16785/c0_g1_i1/m.103430
MWVAQCSTRALHQPRGVEQAFVRRRHLAGVQLARDEGEGCPEEREPLDLRAGLTALRDALVQGTGLHAFKELLQRSTLLSVADLRVRQALARRENITRKTVHRLGHRGKGLRAHVRLRQHVCGDFLLFKVLLLGFSDDVGRVLRQDDKVAVERAADSRLGLLRACLYGVVGRIVPRHDLDEVLQRGVHAVKAERDGHLDVGEELGIVVVDVHEQTRQVVAGSVRALHGQPANELEDRAQLAKLAANNKALHRVKDVLEEVLRGVVGEENGAQRAEPRGGALVELLALGIGERGPAVELATAPANNLARDGCEVLVDRHTAVGVLLPLESRLEEHFEPRDEFHNRCREYGQREENVDEADEVVQDAVVREFVEEHLQFLAEWHDGAAQRADRLRSIAVEVNVERLVHEIVHVLILFLLLAHRDSGVALVVETEGVAQHAGQAPRGLGTVVHAATCVECHPVDRNAQTALLGGGKGL